MHTYENLNPLVGSGSIIFNEQGEPFRQSHNLRGILNHATRRGVWRIHVDVLNDGHKRPGAMVTVFYRGGDVGKVYFVDGSHALNWANDKRNDSPKRSWFVGCEVTSKDWPAGTWTAFQQGGRA
jgi:hypothetical protein